jgi:hypothetical protein
MFHDIWFLEPPRFPPILGQNIVCLKRYSLSLMGTITPRDEAVRRFVHQLGRALDHQRSIFILQSILAERESPSESESEDIESSPVNSQGPAVQRIPLNVRRHRLPLEVRRLCGDDAAKEYEEWSRGVDWATNPLDVVTPHFVRRSDRIRRRAGRLLSDAVHDDPAQANSGKTV